MEDVTLNDCDTREDVNEQLTTKLNVASDQLSILCNPSNQLYFISSKIAKSYNPVATSLYLKNNPRIVWPKETLSGDVYIARKTDDTESSIYGTCKSNEIANTLGMWRVEAILKMDVESIVVSVEPSKVQHKEPEVPKEPRIPVDNTICNISPSTIEKIYKEMEPIAVVAAAEPKRIELQAIKSKKRKKTINDVDESNIIELPAQEENTGRRRSTRLRNKK